MPHTPIHLSPYRADVCWHGVKKSKRDGPERFCGEFGELCEVQRPLLTGKKLPKLLNPLFRVDLIWRRSDSQKITMFLCRRHRDKLRLSGYEVTQITRVT